MFLIAYIAFDFNIIHLKLMTESIISNATFSTLVEKRIAELIETGRQATFDRAVKAVPPPRDFTDGSIHFTLQNLTASFNRPTFIKKPPALSIESLEIKQGEVVYVMGKSGQGKSTLLDLLAKRSKTKRRSGQLITLTDEFDFRRGKLKKLPLTNITLWDENDHQNQPALGFIARQRSIQNQTTTLIVSHRDIGNIFDHADRIIFLEAGEMIWNETPAKTLIAYDDKTLPTPFREFIYVGARNGQWNLELSRACANRPAVKPVFANDRK
jgi:energy-coupling factor transporter ATP-binding protein EcfA2